MKTPILACETCDCATRHTFHGQHAEEYVSLSVTGTKGNFSKRETKSEQYKQTYTCQKCNTRRVWGCTALPQEMDA